MIREILSRTFGVVSLILGLAFVVGAVWAIHDTSRWGYLGAAVAGLLFIGVGWSRLFPNVLEPMPVDSDDPLMLKANEQARRESNRLKRGLHEGRKQALLKFPLKTADGETEHIWAVIHSIDGETATITLANEPVGTLEDENPRQQVHMSDMEDWMLVDGDGKAEGGYTHLAMARIFKREKGYLPRAIKQGLRDFTDFRYEDV